MPRTEVIHDLSDSEKVCPHDGTALRHFSNETSEQLDYTPAQMSLLQHIRRKYTCPYCNNYMVTTNKPAQPIDNNAAENAIRPMVVGRKNWLFAATEKGVHEMSTATCVEDVEALLPAKRGLLRRYAIYKDRWQVELFFKTIKQNLKINTFIGQSKNSILTQTWIAMITYLLLAFARYSAKTGWTVQRILRVIQVNLFERKGLTEILNPDSSLYDCQLWDSNGSRQHFSRTLAFSFISFHVLFSEFFGLKEKYCAKTRNAKHTVKIKK